VFTTKVLTRYDAEFHFCHHCGYLGAADPHWLAEAYSDAIATMDTGLVTRNAALARRCIPIVYSLLGPDRASARCLDFAGGSGLFTRLMRDAGFDYYWTDKYSDNLFARGFEFDVNTGQHELVSAFEVLEHAADPLELVREALTKTSASVFLFTTELFDGSPPGPREWWYYAFETGQHISFFQRRTLETMGSKLGLHFSSLRGLHLFSRQPISVRQRMAATPIRRLLIPWVRRQLDSRTFSDFESIRAQLQNGTEEASEG